MNLRRGLYLIFLVGVISACSESKNADRIQVFSASYNFTESEYDWSAGSADYKIQDSAKVEFNFAYDSLPKSGSSSQKSLILKGNNQDENLFMFIKKKVTGLVPNTEYTLVYDVLAASNVQYGATLSDSDSVRLKVGATTIEPKKVIQNGYYRMNIDKGTDGDSGLNMVAIGAIGVNQTPMQYDFVNKGNSISSVFPYFKVKTNNQGEIWLIIGTDTPFKGATVVYYSSVNIVFSSSN